MGRIPDVIYPNMKWWRCEICGRRIDFPKDWMDDKKIQAIIDHDCIKGDGEWKVQTLKT